MEAPPNVALPPIAQAFFFNDGDERPPPSISSTVAADNAHSAGQNHDRQQGTDAPATTDQSVHTSLAETLQDAIRQDLLPLPQSTSDGLPPDIQHTIANAPLDVRQAITSTLELGTDLARANTESDSRQDDGDSESDHEKREGEEQQQEPGFRWEPVFEDKSVPCEDEQAWIESKDQHSAHDYGYWEKKTFFDLGDPAFVPIESGRIDFLVDKYNGTKESPQTESVLKSHTVRIGGYDWRIKFYPKGNNCDWLSVYVECVDMQAPDFAELEDWSRPPLPFLVSGEKHSKRRTVAAQVCIVMYNPAEPRVYEYKRDAHQFTKKSADYGWTRFTSTSRREFSYRKHGQRRAILRDDKLAFSAFIRVVSDPTNCLWQHGTSSWEDSIACAGLRPFARMTAFHCAQVPLLHLPQFRNLIYGCADSVAMSGFQNILWKMMNRTKSQRYSNPPPGGSNDVIAWLRYIIRSLTGTSASKGVTDLVGNFDPDDGAAVCGNRLRTQSQTSVQAAIDAHPTALATPPLLTLELERHHYDRTKRKWVKLTNKVEMEDTTTVAGVAYTLYSFSTHSGSLTSNSVNVYVRPHGPRGLWYAYTDGNATCLTQAQAVEKHTGLSEGSYEDLVKRHLSSRHHDRNHRQNHRSEELNEVAHVVMYLRDDYTAAAFASPFEEVWEPSEAVRQGCAGTESSDSVEPTKIEVGINAEHVETEKHTSQPPEQFQRRSFDETAGSATPNGYLMDGEDVIMSDPDDGSACSDDDNHQLQREDEVLRPAKIDYLGREYYDGTTLDGSYHGEGHLIATNGDEYTGIFKKHLKCGQGTMTYAATGDIYEGDWLEDRRDGHGKLTELSTGNVYEGGWKNGKKHGKFVLQGTVTDEDKGCCSICYNNEINTAFVDCGHVLACRECAYKIDQCPLCRKVVRSRVELFGVKLAFE